MRSQQLWPGERVIVLGNDEGVKPGEVGVIVSRWIDSLYAVRTKDGMFHWVASPDIDSINPSRHNIAVGDVVKVKSNEHHHPFIQIGDLIQVVKIIDNVDYYKVFVNDQFHWLSNFELAPYTP